MEFPPGPLTFGNHYVDHKDCAQITFPVGQLKIITPTQCVMDRLAATYAWKDPQARDQAVLVAAAQKINWDALQDWFNNEGESHDEFLRFRDSVERKHAQ